MPKRLGASAAVAVLLLTAGCGGAAGSSRPSQDEVSKALQKGTSGIGSQKLTAKQADCVAKEFDKSALSDEALQALVDGDKKYKGSKKDEAALKKVVPQVRTCVA